MDIGVVLFLTTKFLTKMKLSKMFAATLIVASLFASCQKEDVISTSTSTGTVTPTTTTVNRTSLVLGRSVFSNVVADFFVAKSNGVLSYVFVVQAPNLPVGFGGLLASGLLPKAGETTIKNGSYVGDSVNVFTFTFTQTELDSISAWISRHPNGSSTPLAIQPTYYDNKGMTATFSNLVSNIRTENDTTYRPNGSYVIDTYTVDSATLVLGGNIINHQQGINLPVSGTLGARIKRKP